MRALKATLAVREFRALLLSYVVNRAGDSLGALALATVVFEKTGSALATAVLFLATGFLPGLVGPALVARVGAIPSGRFLPPLYVLEAALFAAMALIAGHPAIVLLIALAGVDATLALGGRSVTRAATASVLLPHGLMPEGKAAFNVALAVATVGGPALGGVVIALLGPAWALAADAASFLFAAAAITRAPGLRSGTDGDSPRREGAREGLRASLKYVAADRALRALVFGEGVAFVFFYLVVPVTVVYATRSLHAGASGYAVILAAWGGGIVIGSIAHVRLAGRVGRAMILVSTLAVAAGYLGTAVAPSLALAGVASVIGGIGNGTQWVAVETTVHALVEERFRVRVAAVLEALAALAPGAGIVLGGALTALLSARAAYLTAGLGLIVLVVSVALAHGLRAMRVSAPPPRAAAGGR